MKFSSRGFTLVELMIVIAIIGVLAAALFPAMTGYLSRSRDTARISHVGQIMTAMSTLFQDSDSYAPGGNGPCVQTGANLNKYMGGKVPTDGTRNHCGTANGVYQFGSGTNSSSSPIVYLAANLENTGLGNTGTITGFSGTVATWIDVSGFTKGSGTGYVISR